MSASVSVNVVIDAPEDIWSANFLPARATQYGSKVPAQVQVNTSAGAIFLTLDAAQALVAHLQAALIDVEVTR